MLAPRLRAVGRASLRHCWRSSASSSTPATPSTLSRALGLVRRPFSKKVTLPLPIALAGGYATWVALQDHYGTADNFFEGKFVSNKDPEDIAEFYQAEDLLRIIAIHPIFFDLFMNKVETDVNAPTEETALLSLDETRFRVKLLGMEVSFEIIEQEEEVDGESRIVSFIRHERFIDWFPLLADLGVKVLLWDQTWKYGFETLPDGSIEVYHRCESFTGPWPIRLIVLIHQLYVKWACEKYINGESFGTEDLDRQQEELACIPLHAVRTFIGKLRAEKEKSLEAKRKDVSQDASRIQEEEVELQRLQSLSERAHTITVARRPLSRSMSSKSGVKSTKLVVSDAATQEVLASAMKEAKGNLAIKAAVDELIQNRSESKETRTRTHTRTRTRTETNRRTSSATPSPEGS